MNTKMGSPSNPSTKPEVSEKSGVSTPADAEVICAWMEPKSLEAPGQTTPNALQGSPWWDWSIGYGPFPKPLSLDALWQVEERLTDAQRLDYYMYFLPPRDGELWWDLVHAPAELKIFALAQVIRLYQSPTRAGRTARTEGVVRPNP